MNDSPGAEAKPLKILFVEDDPQIRKFISLTLRSVGYEVIEAVDGPQAMQMIDECHAADLLLTDLVLPGGVGGIEIAQSFGEKFPDGKIIFSTGFLDRSAVSQSEHFVGVEVLIKPYDAEALVSTIESLV